MCQRILAGVRSSPFVDSGGFVSFCSMVTSSFVAGLRIVVVFVGCSVSRLFSSFYYQRRLCFSVLSSLCCWFLGLRVAFLELFDVLFQPGSLRLFL